MTIERAGTLGELKASDFKSVSVKDEMRANLICKLKRREKLFPGIVGYDETVVPQLINAILSKHNLILLGLRGQAKSRIIRQLTNLLDDAIPIIKGSEVNDNPFHPISAYGRQMLELHGDSAHIEWVDRDARFVEKLATPDVMLVFSANPEDYTARGKILSPLKDRIGTEIMTHYPKEIELGVEITRQEAWTARDGFKDRLHVPEFIREAIEQIAFEARDDQRIDKHSGVSQRLPISVLESVVSNAERRALVTGEEPIVPRIADIYAAIPSMTGKMELEYEGEQIGANRIAKDLIKRATGEVFEGYFVGIDFAPAVQWFDQGNNLRLADTAAARECARLLEAVPELIDTALIPFDFKKSDQAQMVAACEFVLEGLYAQNKISRNEEGGYTAVTKAKKDRRGMIYDDLTETGKYS